MTEELRDRVLKLEWALRQQGKRQDEFASALRGIADKLDGMSKAEEIADAVTAAIVQARRGRLTLLQRVAGAIVALVLAIPAAHDLAHWLGLGNGH